MSRRALLTPLRNRQETSHDGLYVQHPARPLLNMETVEFEGGMWHGVFPLLQSLAKDCHDQGRAHVALGPMAVCELHGGRDGEAVSGVSGLTF